MSADRSSRSERPDPDGAGDLVIVDIDEGDIDELVALHLRAFPNSELGRLGAETVRRHYRWQFRGPHDLTALAARSDGEVVGYLLGGQFRGSASGFVRQQRWYLVAQVVRHPSVLVRGSGRRVVAIAARLLARRDRSAPEQPGRVPAGSFGVLVIAVDPDSHRLGVGSALLAAAEDRARRLGFVRMHLTLHPGNVAALSFYGDRGWRRLGLPGDDGTQWLIGKEIAPDAQDA